MRRRWTCVFHAERAVTGTRRVENTVVHEVAHQWFGDAVTASDWNHVWLSEGFATCFTHLFNEWMYGCRSACPSRRAHRKNKRRRARLPRDRSRPAASLSHGPRRRRR